MGPERLVYKAEGVETGLVGNVEDGSVEDGIETYVEPDVEIDVRSPRVLLIAEAANPEWVSVPLEGWSHSRAIARRCEAHVVTHVRNREAFVRAGLREGAPGEGDFTAIDSERLAAPIYRTANLLRGGSGKGWTTVTAFASIAYYYFEHLVWRRFAAPLREGRFDLVHRLTPLSPTAPSLLAGRCRRIGVPFVLGPLNGGVPWPGEFDARRREEKEWLSYLRPAHRLMPGHHATRRHAAAIIAGSQHTLEQIPARHRDKCVYIPENAIDPDRFVTARSHEARRPIRVAFVGRLVPYKGADMLLRAAAPRLREKAMTLEIFGDGPQKPALERIVSEQGLSTREHVRFEGFVEHQALQHRLASCDVLALPSIREFGGAVVLEAMAVGLTPIVVDYGGPAELVTESTGFKIPLRDQAGIESALGAVLGRLSHEPGLIDAMSPAARRRATTRFTWDAKASQVLEVYRWVLGAGEKPDFGMPLPDGAEAEAEAESERPTPIDSDVSSRAGV